MSIKVGDQLPDFKFLTLEEGKPVPKSTTDLFAGKLAVLIAIPGAYTPTCTNTHCPGFAREASLLLSKGVNVVYCTSVNDPFVMDHFADYLKAKGKITFLSDNGEFAKMVGTDIQINGPYMGLRSKRYAMIVDDGVVKYFGIDEQGLEKSSVEEVLKHL